MWSRNLHVDPSTMWQDKYASTRCRHVCPGYWELSNNITRTNYFWSACGEHMSLHGDIWRVWRTSQISLPKTMNVFSTDGLNVSLLLFLLNIHLMLTWWIFCGFTLGPVLYKKVVPAMWSLFRDHSRRSHKTKHSIY